MIKGNVISLDPDNSDDDAVREEVESEDDNSDEDQINEESSKLNRSSQEAIDI